MDRDTIWYGSMPRPQRHCVHGDPPLPRKERQPQLISPCLLGWIRIPLGTEVRLGLCDIVLDGNPAPPLRKGAQQPPLFSPLLWPTLVAILQITATRLV